MLWRGLAAVLPRSIQLVKKPSLAKACLVRRARRCHDRRFLFKFVRDRNQYRQLLWSSLRELPVSALAYCITSNPTHVLARAESDAAISSGCKPESIAVRSRAFCRVHRLECDSPAA